MTIDTGGTIEIRASPARIILITLGAAAFTMVGLEMARGGLAGSGSFVEFIGWATMIFFGAATAGWTWRAIRTLGMRRPVLTLSPKGFQDVRICSDFVPWTEVKKISAWEHQGVEAIVVKVPDTVWRSLAIRRHYRWRQSSHMSVGVDGLWIGTLELGTEFDDLFAMMQAYAAAHGGEAG